MLTFNLARAAASAAARPSAAVGLARRVTAAAREAGGAQLACSMISRSCVGGGVVNNRRSLVSRSSSSRAASTDDEDPSLAEVLRQEYAEEKSLSMMDPELKSMVDVLASKGISIKDEPGSAVVRLFGPGIGNEKVMIEFSCQEEGDGDDGWHDDTEDDSDQVEMSSEQLAEQMKDEEEPEGEDAGFRFVATITKGPKKLIFTGTATNKISLAGVTQCPATADHKDMAVYQGPVFEELDPQVQDSLLAYLRQREIGDDMATFICMYADYKEQMEYLNWLSELESFIT
ncbi:unnamed protein product [Sphacelaria rigidula]